jgi:hypothetical protein
MEPEKYISGSTLTHMFLLASYLSIANILYDVACAVASQYWAPLKLRSEKRTPFSNLGVFVFDIIVHIIPIIVIFGTTQYVHVVYFGSILLIIVLLGFFKPSKSMSDLEEYSHKKFNMVEPRRVVPLTMIGKFIIRYHSLHFLCRF